MSVRELGPRVGAKGLKGTGACCSGSGRTSALKGLKVPSDVVDDGSSEEEDGSSEEEDGVVVDAGSLCNLPDELKARRWHPV